MQDHDGSGKPLTEPAALKPMKPKSALMMFHEVFPILTKICNERGYALAHHGSLARDIDLIAVPWIETPVSPRELISQIMLGLQHSELKWEYEFEIRKFEGVDNPSTRPHGRIAYSIYFNSSDKHYIDISIFAPLEPSTPSSGKDSK